MLKIILLLLFVSLYIVLVGGSIWLNFQDWRNFFKYIRKYRKKQR